MVPLLLLSHHCAIAGKRISHPRNQRPSTRTQIFTNPDPRPRGCPRPSPQEQPDERGGHARPDVVDDEERLDGAGAHGAEEGCRAAAERDLQTTH